MVGLYNATDGANWMRNDKWLSEEPVGTWSGVTTDASGRVTELRLGGNQLNGTIPAVLGNLDNLEALYLDYNQLTGTIPAAIGNLDSLEYLTLRQ